MIQQTTTVQRMVGTFANHGINSAMLMQLQHLQELALAVNLQGKHLVHVSLLGVETGSHIVEVSGRKRGSSWAKADRCWRHVLRIPEGGDGNALREAQVQMGNAATDLMALLEESTQ